MTTLTTCSSCQATLEAHARFCGSCGSRRVEGGAAELLMGESLRELVRARGHLPWREALEIVDGLCTALLQARTHGILYPELTPETVYVHRPAEAPPVVKIVEVGIQLMRGDALTDTLPSPNPVRGRTEYGSLHYASPERLMGTALDVRNDVYLVGVLAYELITGATPFPDAKGPAGIITAHLKQRPQTPSLLRPGLPSSVDALLTTCLEKEPSARFADVTDLSRAVADAVRSA